MKNQKIANNFSLFSTTISVLFHFICCGIPLLLVLFSLLFGINFEVELIKISHPQMTILLIVSGIFLIISYIMYLKDCKGCCNQKFHKVNKIILIIATILYIIGTSGHFLSSRLVQETNHHEMMEHSCH